MGLLDKVKNMFTEEIEEEIEVPVKKEVMQVEIESPRATRSNETPKKEPIRERSNLTDFELEPKVPKEEVKEMIREVKRESKSPAPIYFDDKDFRELERPKTKPKKQSSRKDIYGGNKVVKQPEKKVFKPTPIISPVYGILDKNYQKSEIVNKTENRTSAYGKTMSIDEVRKKAYGGTRIESDVFEETTKKKTYQVTGNTEVLEDLILDVKEQLGEIPKTKIENNLDNIEDELNNLEGTLVEIQKRPSKNTLVSDSNELNLGDEDNNLDELNKLDDNVVNENDLFDLIDSMYEKRNDDE